MLLYIDYIAIYIIRVISLASRSVIIFLSGSIIIILDVRYYWGTKIKQSLYELTL